MTSASERGDFLARHGAALIDNGFSIVPIPPGTKGPRLPGWQDIRSTRPILRRWVAKAGSEDFGVGILTRDTPAIDIDATDEMFVEHMLQWIQDHVGFGPVRVGKAPKALMLFRTDTPFKKVTSGRWKLSGKPKPMQCEVLGDGQQFVAYHIHPDTRKPYVWPDIGRNPLDRIVSELPSLNYEQAVAVCAEFDRMAAKMPGWIRVGTEEEQRPQRGIEAIHDPMAYVPPPEETEEEVEKLKSAIENLKTKISEASYDRWFSYMAAIGWTGWSVAKQLALDLSEASDKHGEEHFERTWHGLQKRERSSEFTLGTIYHFAKDNGWEYFREVTIAEEREALSELLEEVNFFTSDVKPDVKFFKKIIDANLSIINTDVVMTALKKATGIALAVLRKELAQARKPDLDGELPTHGGYASSMLKVAKAASGVQPVGVAGSIYTFDGEKGVFVGRETSEYSVNVCERFDGQEKCERRSDYVSIANHIYDMAAKDNQDFFDAAPIGLACEGRFYRVTDSGEIEREELTSRHRQRMISKYRPVVGPMPIFRKFIEETFAGDSGEQIGLLQETGGATLLGFMSKHEKALQLKGKGRSGKGTWQKLIQELMPKEFVGAVPPEKWDNEYYLASLANIRVNIVGELDESMPIPAAQFKTVLGRDLLIGRQPSGRTFTFKNTASHIFSTNHFVPTKDHSSAFYSRWLLVWFKNSRLDGADDAIDTDLVQKMIDGGECPAITAWLLQGAKRVAARGRFLETPEHRLLMAQWRERSSPLIEFLFDADEVRIDPKVSTPRKFVYDAYTNWCRESNRRPLGKIKFYDEIRETREIGAMGVKLGFGPDGRDLVRGVILRTGASVFMDESGGNDDEL